MGQSAGALSRIYDGCPPGGNRSGALRLSGRFGRGGATAQYDFHPHGWGACGQPGGTIPAWTGGYAAPKSGYQQGKPRPDPFSGEKPLFSITAANVSNYATKLPEGAKTLFAKFPDYRMDIYPTHRTAAAPQSVYENIFRNATRARAAAAGIAYGVEGAAGGSRFRSREWL